MHVVSVCPLRVSSLVWQTRPGAWVLTIACKATYRLEPRVSPLAAEQEHPNDDDNHWDDDPRKSVYAPSDLVPFKTRADVLLVGYAYSPGGAPVSSLLARLVVGEVDKSVAVHADRSWTLDGRIRDGALFTRMPLRYERAAGGPDSVNPVGVRPDLANASGEIAIPNLWPVGRGPQQRGEIIEPIAFAPIAATWPSRRDKLGPLARGFSLPGLAGSALPLDIEPAYFNSGPRDQQVTELRADERIVLENLLPGAPRFSTNLAGASPRAYVERPSTPPQEIAMRADTLWIDTDRRLATMTWRGQVPMTMADEPGRVLVGMALGADRLTWADLASQADRIQSVRNLPSPLDTAEIESLSEDDIREAGDSMVLSPQALAPAGRPPAPPPAPDAPPEGDAQSTLFLFGVPDAAQTLPFSLKPDGKGPDDHRKAEQARGGDALPPGWAPPAPPPPPVAAPPPLMGRPALFDVPDSPAPRPEPPREVPVAVPLSRATDAGRDAAKMGVFGLSDAAAAAHRVVEQDRRAADVPPVASPEERLEPRARPAEILKLLWFDPKVVARLHRHADWRILLAEMELRALDEGDDEDDAPGGAADSKARKSVFEVLSRGLPSPADTLKRALSEAVDDRGLFEPPLVLLSGELEFPFDEVEALKAAVTVLTPLGPTDKKVKDALDAANDFLRTPGADQFARLAEGLLEKLREAFSIVRKSLPVDYVDSNTERALLRQRAYSMKTLYGKRWIRALLRGAGGGGGAGRGDGGGRGDGASRGGESAPPVYLPEALKDELPAYKRVRVKALGEVDLQEDQEESASWVVKVTALARVVGGI